MLYKSRLDSNCPKCLAYSYNSTVPLIESQHACLLPISYHKQPRDRIGPNKVRRRARLRVIFTRHTLTLSNRPVAEKNDSSDGHAIGPPNPTRSGRGHATSDFAAGTAHGLKKPSSGRTVSRIHQTQLPTSPLTLRIAGAERRFQRSRRSE